MMEKDAASELVIQEAAAAIFVLDAKAMLESGRLVTKLLLNATFGKTPRAATPSEQLDRKIEDARREARRYRSAGEVFARCLVALAWTYRYPQESALEGHDEHERLRERIRVFATMRYALGFAVHLDTCKICQRLAGMSQSARLRERLGDARGARSEYCLVGEKLSGGFGWFYGDGRDALEHPRLMRMPTEPDFPRRLARMKARFAKTGQGKHMQSLVDRLLRKLPATWKGWGGAL